MVKKNKVILILFFIFILGVCNLNYCKEVNAATTNMSIAYNTHIQNVGWETAYSKKDGETSGTSGRSLRLEAINIKLQNAPSGINLKYQVHVQNIGWQEWKNNGQTAGTSGKSLRLEAIKIKLEGTKEYKVQYRVHVQNIGWQEWKEDGELAGTEGQSLRLEAIQIRIVKVDSPTVSYNSHIARIGWENSFSKTNGQTSGTTGRGLGMEAIKIKLTGVPSNANIQYQAHVQNIGWQNWTNEGNIAGTTGKGLNIEAIKIKLNNLPGKSIQYRAHVQNIGWQEWKEDGELAGTTGKSLRIEAIEIRIVNKIIPDTTSPVITLNGSSTVTVKLGDKYIDAGATATDNIDGNITGKIKTTSNVNTLKAGTYTVKYEVTDAANNKATKTRTVQVVDYMTGIAVTAPSKTEYKYNENLDLTGMKVQKVMASGNKVTLSSSEYSVSGYNKTKLGEQTITVTYSGKTATFKVKVVDYMTGITITAPSKTEYKYNENIDLTGMIVQKVMASGSKVTLSSSEYSVSGYNKITLGEQTITVAYSGKTATFKVRVNNYIKGIELKTKPTKLNYIEGEDIDLSGMKLNALMADNTKQEISLSDTNLSINPKTNISYLDNKVELKYTTTNTINNSSAEFKTTFDIIVLKQLKTLVIEKEQDAGYAHEQFVYGTISSGENEEEVDISTIKYQILNENDEDITSQGIVTVKFEEESARPGENLIKVTAEKAGIYKIIHYIGENIETSIKATAQIVEITDNTTIESVEIANFNERSIRINQVLNKALVVKNIHGDILENVAINEIEIVASGIGCVLLDENNNPGTVVTGIQLKGTTVGTQEIKVKVNNGTKVISLGNVETLPELEKLLNVGDTTKVTLLAEEPLQEQNNIAVVNGAIYTLIPVKLVEEETMQEIAIKGNQLILGNATEEKPFGVTYTGYSTSELFPLIDVQMFKDKNIVTSSVDANYLGIAITFGTSKEELEGKQLTLKYGNSQINLNIEVEDLRINELIINQKNVAELTGLPTIENHVKTSVGTIYSGEGQEELLVQDLQYRVKNEANEDITSTNIVKVTFEEEVANPGEIQINVETSKEGIYTIIPYIMVGENEVSKEQKIESINNSVVTEVAIENISTAEITERTAFESKIIFKNKYGDILTDVKKSTINVSGENVNIVLLKDENPVENDEDNVTDIQIVALTSGDKIINIIVNKGTTEEKTIPIEFTAKEITIELNVNNMTEIRLYETEPITSIYETCTDNGYVYTLIPISLTGTDDTIKGSDISNGKLTYSISNDEIWSIDVQLFDENKIVTNTGNTAKYVGIALGLGYAEEELNGVTITLTYGTSSKTLTINND